VVLALGVHVVVAVWMARGEIRTVQRQTPKVAWAQTSNADAVTVELRTIERPTPPAEIMPPPTTTPPPRQTGTPAPSSTTPETTPNDDADVGDVAAPTDDAAAADADATDDGAVAGDLAPRPENVANLPPGFGPSTPGMMRVIRGADSRGPVASADVLRGALDYQTDADKDFGKSGAALAAAKAGRALRRDLAFHDVTVGMASDWFRELKGAAERGFRPSPSDLDNPGEVTQAAIFENFLKDPSAWDDEAKRVLGPMLAASAMHSQDPIKRLALGNNAGRGTHSDTQLRMSTVDDMLRRKEAGLSVRFAFEVDVHHDGDGKVTGIDILRDQYERQLQEKIRFAIEDAVRQASPAPALVNKGKPFRSRWLFAATWFIDPPGCMLMPSDAMGAVPGVGQGMCGGTFDITPDGLKTSSFDVQQKVSAELLRIMPLGS
jgi:hypothetical protein